MHKCCEDGHLRVLPGKDGGINANRIYETKFMIQCPHDVNHLIFPHQRHFHLKGYQCRIKKTTSAFDLTLVERLEVDPPEILEFPDFFDEMTFVEGVYDFNSVKDHVHYCPRDEWTWRMRGGVIEDFTWHFDRKPIQRCVFNDDHWILPHQDSIHESVCKGLRPLTRWRSEDHLVLKSRKSLKDQKVSEGQKNYFCAPIKHGVRIRRFVKS